MEKITAGHPLSQSEDIIKQNIDTLKALFPTIVKEGKIDIGELKALLGEDVEENEEYYRFTWAGKSQARQEANKPSTGTLRPNKADSKDWDTTQNIFIEGDNLEVLKLLQKSYAGAIKMIYIDPPYNTGKDFVYKDNYKDNLGNYLEITGQVDEKGNRLGTNSDSDGRYHSNWLNMMYPRLKLARNLMKDDGVIFISIDDNELNNLRKLCDEIYGEENFMATIVWKKRSAPDARTIIGSIHDYIVCYIKSSINYRKALSKMPLSDERRDSFQNPDNDVRGAWASVDMTGQTGRAPKSQYYDIVLPSGRTIGPPQGRAWGIAETTFKQMVIDNRIWFGKSGDNMPRMKRFLSESEGQAIPSYWDMNEIGSNDEAKKELNDLLEQPEIFDTPKPTRLLKRLVTISTSNETSDIVLDFFAGAGTTASAVMSLNAEGSGNRKFIAVQLPEKTPKDSAALKAGYLSIADITKERIRRAGEKTKIESKSDLFSKEDNTIDLGFKAFKLDTSNVNAWDGSIENFEQNLFNSAKNIKEDRTEDDVLYEILLKNGLDLSQPIEEKEIGGKRVYNIGLGALFICLADNISTATAEGIGQWKTELNPATCTVIFKDAGLTDVEKANSIQILKRYGITEVNSI